MNTVGSKTPRVPLNSCANDVMARKAELLVGKTVWADPTSQRIWVVRKKRTSAIIAAKVQGVVGDLVTATLGTFGVTNQLSSISGLNVHDYVPRNIAGGLYVKDRHCDSGGSSPI